MKRRFLIRYFLRAWNYYRWTYILMTTALMLIVAPVALHVLMSTSANEFIKKSSKFSMVEISSSQKCKLIDKKSVLSLIRNFKNVSVVEMELELSCVDKNGIPLKIQAKSDGQSKALYFSQCTTAPCLPLGITTNIIKLEDVWQQIPWAQGKLSQVVLKAANAEALAVFINTRTPSLRARVRHSFKEAELQTLIRVKAFYRNAFLFSCILGFIAFITISVGFINQRKKSFAVMRACGAETRHLINLLVLELGTVYFAAVCVSLISVAVGTLALRAYTATTPLLISTVLAVSLPLLPVAIAFSMILQVLKSSDTYTLMR